MESRERKSVVASGKTVEDAITNGLAILGVRRDQVDIEIIHPGSRGLLGIGAEDARVQLEVKAPPVAAPRKPAEAPVPEVERRTVAPEVERRAVAPEVERREPIVADVPPPERAAQPAARPPAPAAPAREAGLAGAYADAAQAGREILGELLQHMGFKAGVEAHLGEDLGDEGEEPPLVLNIRGDDLGVLIGRRGETLAAMQYMVRLMVSHRVKHWTDVVVDVESYRSRRRRALESLANRVAERVVASGRTQALEPMPAYERRIVHITLRNHTRVFTQSVGVGEKRKVTIVPKK